MFKKSTKPEPDSPQKSLPLVYVYGFDQIGLPAFESFETSGHQVHFIPFQSDFSLEPATGIIIPSGVFEKIDVDFDGMGQRKLLHWAENELAVREKQVINAQKRGAWLIFLVRVIDVHMGQWWHSDLAKKHLRKIVGYVDVVQPAANLQCKADEFRKYLDRFGIAQSTFYLDSDASGHRVLAVVDETPVGLEINSTTFFLPFFTTKASKAESKEIASLLVDSVTEYKRKNQLYLPDWVKELRFQVEAQLLSQIEQMEERILSAFNQIQALGAC